MPSQADQLTIDAWRSLRASRARRGAALRRRRLLRGRRAAVVIAGVFALTAGGALAAPGHAGRMSVSTVKSVQRALHVEADGVIGPRTRRAIRRFQRREGLDVDGILGPATLGALGLDARGSGSRGRGLRASADSGGGAGAAGEDAGGDVPPAPTAEQEATLARIADCESGGDPTAISSNGRYRGKYQFDRRTWRRMGGSGDPAAASEAEQDARAAKLLDAQGTAPWPACG